MKEEQNKKIPQQVYDLARQRGFDSAKIPQGIEVWNGYKVYSLYKRGKKCYCGLPQFVFQKGNEFRFATEKETHLIVFNC